MASWFEFLERLERDGVVRRLDPRTITAVEDLLAADFNDAELLTAIASLLASSPGQWQQIEGRARAFLADHDSFLRGKSTSSPSSTPTPPLELRLAPIPGALDNAIAHKIKQLADSRSRIVGWILPSLLLAFVLGLALAAISFFWAVDEAIEASFEPPQTSDFPLPERTDEPPIAPTPIPADARSGTNDAALEVEPKSMPALPGADGTVPEAPPRAATQPDGGPQPLHHPSPVFLLALMFVSYALIVAGLRWLAAPRAQRTRAMALHDRDARDARGPRVIYHVPAYPPFAVPAMDAAATLLARLPRAGHGIELDIDATLRATVAAGGRTTPVLTPTHTAQELTILVDLERGDHPGRSGVEWVLRRWSQGGLRFVRVDFQHHPGVLWIHPGRRETTLDALGRRLEGTPLLLFARATRLREFAGGHAWLRQLGPWPVRAIIDLDPRESDDPALLPEEREARRALARAGIKRFPFTAVGLVAMARHIGSGGVLQSSPPDEPLRPATTIEPELKAWASCLACVPDPSWAQLEVFRREFFAAELPDPRYVQRLLDHVAPALNGNIPDDPVTADGTRINLSRAKVRHHREQLHRLDDYGRWRDLEVRAREVILRQLRGTDPAARTDQRLRDFKMAVHEAILAERDPQHDPGADLQVFVGDEMEEDLRRWVADEKARRGTDVPDWLTRLESAIERGDLQVAHMGQWLLPRNLREVVPDSLALTGLSWLGVGAWLQLSWLAATGGVALGGGVAWLVRRRRGASGFIGLLALLTAGFIYMYIQSPSNIVQPPTKSADPSETVNESLELLLAKARELKQAGKLHEALGAYEAILTVDPNHAQAMEQAAALKEQLVQTAGTNIDPIPDTKTSPDTKIEPEVTMVAFSVEVIGPKKAEVFVDDVLRGKTPLKLDLKPGSHRFEVKAHGWVSHIETLEVAADGPPMLKPKLTRKAGFINTAEENAATNDLDNKGVETKFEVRG